MTDEPSLQMEIGEKLYTWKGESRNHNGAKKVGHIFRHSHCRMTKPLQLTGEDGKLLAHYQHKIQDPSYSLTIDKNIEVMQESLPYCLLSSMIFFLADLEVQKRLPY